MSQPSPFEADFFEPPQIIAPDAALSALKEGELTLHGLLPWSSNYTFLGTIETPTLKFNVVYKPCRGERPLWDFEQGSLCRREVAAFELSRALGWPAVPPTVLRTGEHGPGSVQQFIYADYDIHYFVIEDEPAYQTALQQLAVFDVLANNADRKGGHCLVDYQHNLWAIDHGLTFHTEYKLRTVIWKFAGQPLPPAIRQQLAAFQTGFTPQSRVYRTLQTLIAPEEVEALAHRLAALLAEDHFPLPKNRRPYPYPPI